ncbi:hypothetical protein FGADI_972 [Fusarium gaditjirri]|uniref:Fe-containing alcohol dehydrogenase-like C-terminal domain-containing protein n=1 Tax=Fusarium gaditjirri TaxID=282569 RepID=A0A8H4TLS4_9HYPO|nr:hypothetical protein FGADI_972 [Fusarium gaditjirri]
MTPMISMLAIFVRPASSKPCAPFHQVYLSAQATRWAISLDLNVSHEETSCILLPAVLDIPLKKNTVKSLFPDKKISEGDVDVGAILGLMIRELEMPQTLKDVGVASEYIPGLAANSLNDVLVNTNASVITKMDEVIDIFEAVAGKWKHS